jgi:hypothetical protein
MELGNMFFGNSRGNYEVPRYIVDSDEWQTLVHKLVQVYDYHCSIEGDYYQNYDTANLVVEERTSPIKPDEYGGCELEVDGKIIFQINPYWWDDCTCGAEQENEKKMKKVAKKIFTKEEYKIYQSFDKLCKDNCPIWKDDNYDKPIEEQLKICTCGTVKKNIELKKKQEAIKDKIAEYERIEREEYIPHKDTCRLCLHNFIYHPGQEDEFYIEWYKYPFRDSYMNKNLSKDEILAIFKDCSDQIIKKYGTDWLVDGKRHYGCQ